MTFSPWVLLLAFSYSPFLGDSRYHVVRQLYRGPRGKRLTPANNTLSEVDSSLLDQIQMKPFPWSTAYLQPHEPGTSR